MKNLCNWNLLHAKTYPHVGKARSAKSFNRLIKDFVFLLKSGLLEKSSEKLIMQEKS